MQLTNKLVLKKLQIVYILKMQVYIAPMVRLHYKSQCYKPLKLWHNIMQFLVLVKVPARVLYGNYWARRNKGVVSLARIRQTLLQEGGLASETTKSVVPTIVRIRRKIKRGRFSLGYRIRGHRFVPLFYPSEKRSSPHAVLTFSKTVLHFP